MTLVDVTPIGKRTSRAFVHRLDGSGGLEDVEFDVFPPEHVARGQGLRNARVSLGLSLREAAEALAISAVDLGRLERGAATLSLEGWDEVVQRLAKRSVDVAAGRRFP